MKILFVSNMRPSKSYPYSGRFILDQMEEINRSDDYSIDFVSIDREKTQILGTILKYLKLYFMFYKKIIFRKYDIIHIHYYFPTIFVIFPLVWFHRNVKIVVTFYGGDIDFFDLSSVIWRFALGRLTASIFMSKALLHKIKGQTKNQVVIPAGIKDSFINHRGERDIDLIFAGSFETEKGVDVFFDIIDRVLLTLDHLNIAIVGTGSLLPLVQEMCEARKKAINVVFFGTADVQGMISLFNRSKVLISSSRLESFGLVIAEAMSCGCVAVCTKTDGALEQIVNEQNGYLIEGPFDPFVQLRLPEILLNYEAEMELTKNAERSANTYKYSEIAAKMISLYNRVV